MKNGKFWKAMLSVLLGVGIFLVCLFPLRALMNYHEEHHLFRWTGYYLREQLSSWDGTVEYAVSFLIQFFYIGWLGALIVALLTVGLQRLFWWLMKTIRLRSDWFYPTEPRSCCTPVLLCLHTSALQDGSRLPRGCHL